MIGGVTLVALALVASGALAPSDRPSRAQAGEGVPSVATEGTAAPAPLRDPVVTPAPASIPARQAEPLEGLARNQEARAIVRIGALVVTLRGRAMSAARTGESASLINASTGRRVTGVVAGPGLIEVSP